jgi:putative thioredoxin
MSASSDATIIRCPQCQKRNRVHPAAQGIPRCANCHRPLPWVVSTHSEGYEAEITASVPVLVDFWAPWCGPCRQLTPALERAAEARAGSVELVKINTDENPNISRAFQIQGIPAVKAFRNGREVAQFVGAAPPAQVERFFDALVPSEVDQLVAAGDDASLRRALELEPNRRDARVMLAQLLFERGDRDEALALVEGLEGDFAAEGLAARMRLEQQPGYDAAFKLLDEGKREEALDALIAAIPTADGLKDDIRRAVVGILATYDQGDPTARSYRMKLSSALY